MYLQCLAKKMRPSNVITMATPVGEEVFTLSLMICACHEMK